uniref:EscU/YscU/HrcU family type III secretion system export apparatus switch protein n=1 Tax=Stappia sp. TaxID=1870903 RepID=UPI003BA94110
MSGQDGPAAPSGPGVAPTAQSAALAYDQAGAPRDTARARGELAARLLADAVANGVSVEDDAALADLMASVPFDEDVPPELFEAVALILRHVLDLPRSSGG